MCSWPLTSEVPVVDSLGQCALCDEVFPFVNVLNCRRLKGGEVPVCLTCHQRLHPGCGLAQSVLGANHYLCRVCGTHPGNIVCALCSLSDSSDEILEGVLMCEGCSDDIHATTKQHHTDHFYPVASPEIVTVRGSIHWHNRVDFRHELATNRNLHVHPSRGLVSANHQGESFQASGGPKRLPAGEKANHQSQVVKQRGGDRGSFQRFTRAV